MTGSLPPGGEQVHRQPLGPPAGVSNAPLYNKPLANVAQEPVVGKADGWTAAGGTAIIVGKADTLAALSNRYGVPPAALLSTNGLKRAADLRPGNRIIIPVYGAAAGTRVAQVADRTASDAGQTKFRLVQGLKPVPNGKAVPAKSEKSAQPEKSTKAEKSTKSEKSGKTSDKTEKSVKSEKAAKTKVDDKQAKAPQKSPPAKQETKAAGDAKLAKASPASASEKSEKAKPANDPQETASVSEQEKSEGTSFRWPAHGRVIAGFGAKGGNEGINIAVPEGTPVKATEGGVVAYAGSELKGYGNLVLVRHDNGWVSAYANNGEILVKRGEHVKRGQTVAKSGQSGNVSSPQLHFELRKGATPVDPMPHLTGG